MCACFISRARTSHLRTTCREQARASDRRLNATSPLFLLNTARSLIVVYYHSKNKTSDSQDDGYDTEKEAILSLSGSCSFRTPDGSFLDLPVHVPATLVCKKKTNGVEKKFVSFRVVF